MNHTIATDMLTELQILRDKCDTLLIHTSSYSIEYKEAFDLYWEQWKKVHELIMIGLEHKG